MSVPDRNWRTQARRSRRSARRAWTAPVAAIAGTLAAAAVLAVAATASTAPSAPPPAASTPTSTAPAAPTPTATATPAPSVDVDVDDPEALARLWAEAFFTRADAGDDAWQQTIAPFTSPNLLAQLERSAYVEGTVLEAAASSTVAAIEILPPAADVEVSTPIRWSNTVQVTVVDDVGDEHGLEYSVILFATDDGWTLTDARLLAYERP